MSMMRQTLLLAVVAAVVAPTRSHTLHTGRTCPPVEPLPDFNRDRINGTWVVQWKTDESNTCILWEFKRTGDNTFKLYEAREISLLNRWEIEHVHALTATLETEDPAVPANMRVDWSDGLTGKADFVVFDTDYDNFMAVHECDRAGFLHRRSVAIMTRKDMVDPAVLARVQAKLDTFGVPYEHLNPIVQSNDCKTGQ